MMKCQRPKMLEYLICCTTAHWSSVEWRSQIIMSLCTRPTWRSVSRLGVRWADLAFGEPTWRSVSRLGVRRKKRNKKCINETRFNLCKCIKILNMKKYLKMFIYTALHTQLYLYTEKIQKQW